MKFWFTRAPFWLEDVYLGYNPSNSKYIAFENSMFYNVFMLSMNDLKEKSKTLTPKTRNILFLMAINRKKSYEVIIGKFLCQRKGNPMYMF